jgi:elongation factor Ts
VGGISAKAVKELREKTGAGMMDCKRALSDASGDAEKAVELLRERGLAKAVKREGRETTEGAVAMALVGDAAALVEVGCETDFVAKTSDFESLTAALAGAVAADASIDSVDALLGTKLDGETVEEKIKAAISKLGENIVVKRVGRVSGGRVGGYVHLGGKLGVVVALQTEAAGEPVEVLAKDLAMHVAAADPSPVAVGRDAVPGNLIEKERELFRRQAEQDGKPAGVGRVNKYYKEIVLLEQAFVKDPDRTVKKLVADVGDKVGGEIRVLAFERFKLGEKSE